MAWIKRNLFMVVGSAIALALLGLAIFFLYTKIGKDNEVTALLDETTQKYKDILGRPVHPGSGKVNNITTAKEEVKTLGAFLTNVQTKYTRASSTNTLSTKEFRSLLDNTVSRLQKDGERYGVALPMKDYWFTFAAQKSSVEFPPATVASLSSQLTDIRSICSILYQAKISSLVGLKRVPVAKEDTAGTADYTNAKPSTNEWAISTPYEVVFQGFTPELESVLEGLLQAPECFIVKNVVSEKAAATSALTQVPMMSPVYPGQGMNPYGSPEMARRYGRRYGPTPQMAPPPVAARPVAPRTGLSTVLDENKLKFTLRIDVVKLKPLAAKPSK